VVDDGADDGGGHDLGPHAHQIVDLEATFDADRLVGADDLLDEVAAVERQQQALSNSGAGNPIQHQIRRCEAEIFHEVASALTQHR
jgi:hypothetical protein